MHVALLAPSWPVPRIPNGIVTYVSQLRAELLRQGHRVSVLAFRLTPGDVGPGVHVVRPSMGFRLRRRLAALGGAEPQGAVGWGVPVAAALRALHATDPIDVIEMEESFGWCADVQRLQPVPVVVKLHGPAFLTLVEEAGADPAAQRRMAIEGEALRQMPAIVSPSRNTLRQTVAHYGLAPAITAVVPNPMGVDPGLALWDAAHCEPRTLLFVGRFDKIKGGDIALLAFRRLLQQDPQLKLVFVGPDPGLTTAAGGRVHFDAFCATHFDAAQRQRIDQRGTLRREQIEALRLQAAVTVVCSRFDNQPATALEAMVQAAPVVAVDAGGVGELIEHGVTGLLAPLNDLDALCACIREALDDRAAAAQRALAARELVLQRHSVARLAGQALELYRRVIAERGGGHWMQAAPRSAA